MQQSPRFVSLEKAWMHHFQHENQEITAKAAL